MSWVLGKLIVASPTSHPEDVRRLNLRIQLDVVSPPMPHVAHIAEQIVHLINASFHGTELIYRNINIRILFSMWVEVYHHENDVVPRRRHFAVKKNCIVIGVIKSKVIVRLQGAVFSADLV